MNFIKEPGRETYTINEIFAEDLQQRLRKKLLLKGKICREIEQDFDGANKGATFIYKGAAYPNTTYAFKGDNFSQLGEGMEMLTTQLLDSLPEKCHVDFRQKVTITQEDDGKYLTLRLAVVPL